MLRLVPAFCAALLLHLFLLWLPMPDQSHQPSLPVSREVTINLTSEINGMEADGDNEVQKEVVAEDPEKESPQSEPEPEPEKQSTPEHLLREEEKKREQPLKHLKPAHFKKKIAAGRAAARKEPELRKPDGTEEARPETTAPPSRKSGETGGQPSHRETLTGNADRESNPRPSKANAPRKQSRPVVEKASPLYRENPPPPYPVLAKRRGWQGRVILSVEVTSTGEVKNVAVKKSSGFTILDKAALKTVRQWRFSPGTRNGRAVAMQVEIPVKFRIK